MYVRKTSKISPTSTAAHQGKDQWRGYCYEQETVSGKRLTVTAGTFAPLITHRSTTIEPQFPACNAECMHPSTPHAGLVRVRTARFTQAMAALLAMIQHRVSDLIGALGIRAVHGVAVRFIAETAQMGAKIPEVSAAGLVLLSGQVVELKIRLDVQKDVGRTDDAGLKVYVRKPGREEKVADDRTGRVSDSDPDSDSSKLMWKPAMILPGVCRGGKGREKVNVDGEYMFLGGEVCFGCARPRGKRHMTPMAQDCHCLVPYAMVMVVPSPKQRAAQVLKCTRCAYRL